MPHSDHSKRETTAEWAAEPWKRQEGAAPVLGSNVAGAVPPTLAEGAPAQAAALSVVALGPEAPLMAAGHLEQAQLPAALMLPLSQGLKAIA